jgi:hypothetical protein
VVDVAADDHDGADLGAGPPEAGEHRGQKAEAAVPQQGPERPARPGAQRAELLVVLLAEVAHGLQGQRRDDGRDQQPLGDDHGRRREQQAQHPQRPAAREHEVDDETDDHRRQAHEGVEEGGDHGPAGKAVDRDRRAQRQAEEGRQPHRRQADAQRKPHDLDQIRVAGGDQAKRRRQGLAEVVHPAVPRYSC